MTDGNGHAPLLSLRWLRTLGRRQPRGPYTGIDVERGLAAEGWQPAESPFHGKLYRHPDKTHPVAVNPYWESFYENDATFQILARQMGISHQRVISLLEGERKSR
jgi:hypothetical protein